MAWHSLIPVITLPVRVRRGIDEGHDGDDDKHDDDDNDVADVVDGNKH